MGHWMITPHFLPHDWYLRLFDEISVRFGVMFRELVEIVSSALYRIYIFAGQGRLSDLLLVPSMDLKNKKVLIGTAIL
jgi:hypothetical protein